MIDVLGPIIQLYPIRTSPSLAPIKHPVDVKTFAPMLSEPYVAFIFVKELITVFLPILKKGLNSTSYVGIILHLYLVS